MPNLRALRWLGIAAPLAFVVGLGLLLRLGLTPNLPDPIAYAIAGVIAAVAIAAFAWAIFDQLERIQARLERQAEELRALYEAGMVLSSELSLDALLQKLVDLGRLLTGARYGALGVLAADGSIERFHFSGISEEEARRIGDLPQGRGLLGVILKEGASLRLRDIASDPRRASFPPNHPPMRSLLGLPVVSRGKVIGNLYLTDKQPAAEFSERDEEIVRLLTTQAAIAIENAQLYERVKSLALLEERERIGMDLHDGVIQSIYAVGLALEDVAERAEESPSLIREHLDKAIDELNRVIRDIRNYIFDLRPQVSEVSDLKQALRDLVDEVKVNTLMESDLLLDGELPPLGQEQALGLFHIAQEALNNVAKHADASTVRVRLAVNNGVLTLEVSDNGRGFDPEAKRDKAKHGLRNIQDRARTLDADLKITSATGKGTTVRVTMALAREESATPNGG